MYQLEVEDQMLLINKHFLLNDFRNFSFNDSKTFQCQLLTGAMRVHVTPE